MEIDESNDSCTDRSQHFDQEKQKHGHAVQEDDPLNITNQQVECFVRAIHKRSAMYCAQDVCVFVHVLQEIVKRTSEAAHTISYAGRDEAVPTAGDAIDERDECGANLANVYDQRSEGHCAKAIPANKFK